MAAVVVYPLTNDNAVLAARQAPAIKGAPGAIVAKAAPVATFAPKSEELIK